MTAKPEPTAVAKANDETSLARFEQYGSLNLLARAEVQRSRVVREVADLVGLTEWGKNLDVVGRTAMAKWCIRRDVDPITEIDNVGGPYINSEYWIRKLGELRVRRIVSDVTQDNIARDARLESLVKDKDAPEDVRERAKVEHYRRLELRAKYGAPEEATGVCLTLIHLTAGGDPIPGIKWGGGGTSVKQPRSGGGSAPNPVVENNAVLSVESQSIRRAMRQLALTAPAALPEYGELNAEVRELAETVGIDKRLGSGEPAPMSTAGGAWQAGDGYEGETPERSITEAESREPGEEPVEGQLALNDGAPRRGKNAVQEGR